jgi:hypothetical protein
MEKVFHGHARREGMERKIIDTAGYGMGQKRCCRAGLCIVIEQFFSSNIRELIACVIMTRIRM